MLIATQQIQGCTLEGADGDLGTVKDVLFDRQSWTVRYLEVSTGGWLRDRRVILSPEVILAADYAERRLGTRLDKQQVENSPSVETDLPVSRRKEIELAQYFAWGAYWANIELAHGNVEPEGDPNLHSTSAVSGYQVGVSDGDVGHVDDFILDDGGLAGGPWEIRYLVIDTGNWLPGRKVLLPPVWADMIDWNTRRVEISMARETVENSPAYDASAPINRQYEEVLYDYYGRPSYWRPAHRV